MRIVVQRVSRATVRVAGETVGQIGRGLLLLVAIELDDTEAVVLGVPAKLLPHGDYALKLSGMTASGGLEDVGKYHFRVVQK